MLGLAWCFLGASKLFLPDTDAYAQVAGQWQLTKSSVHGVFNLLAMAEACIGVGLLLRRTQHAAIGASLILGSVFLAIATSTGSSSIGCGCAGRIVVVAGTPRFLLAAALFLGSYGLLRSIVPSKSARHAADF